MPKKSLNLNQLSDIGIGTYRMSIRSKEHEAALISALKLGCNLIDTSSNYTDGEAEALIGKVLSENPDYSTFVITKAGYIQGRNLDNIVKLNKENKAKGELVDLGPNLKHSIHPEFLEDQINQSKVRMKTDVLDGFLLHNPEYFFQCHTVKELSIEEKKDEYYKRIKTAFIFLEEKVKQKEIKYYGISSNNFVLPPEDENATDLREIIKIANDISKHHHFKLVQFPYNFVENSAIKKQYVDDKNEYSLIDLCKQAGLITFGNRPLNAFSDDGLIRLATYNVENLSESDIKDIFDACMQRIENQWPKEEGLETLYQIPIIKQFCEVWDSLPTPDAVDQVFHGHLFPFLARLWGGDGVPKEEAHAFYVLYDTAILLARKEMTSKALNFKKGLVKDNILDGADSRPLAVLSCERYLKDGPHHILVGMRTPKYVEQLHGLF